MYELIRNFPQQLEEAIFLGQKTQLTTTSKDIHHVVVSGMGGSSIGGLLVKEWVANQLLVPMEVNQDYSLPAYINQHTLLVVISYSGNTEETIQAFKTGLEKQAKIICITSGGLIDQLAKEYSIDLMTLPAGRPPRACLDHTIVALLFILQFHQLITWDFVTELQAAIELLKENETALQPEAQQIALHIQGKIPVIYTTSPYEGVAMRFKQQLNENSKQLCWYNTIPALNHNEIVGWHSADQHLAVLMFSSQASHDRIHIQQEITQAIIKDATRHFTLLMAKGETYLVRSLYLIHLGDWISFFLAQLKGVDPLVVKNIDQVKSTLLKYT